LVRLAARRYPKNRGGGFNGCSAFHRSTLVMALFPQLYKHGLDEAIGLTAIIIMVLLDDEIHKVQKKALIDFVNALPPQKNYVELGSKVHKAICDLAINWKERDIPNGAAGLLWKLKQGDAAK
jgi:hypothetical protein